ncbi:MAG TPA: type I-B CRISPR-associated protein Cas7/Cst2/DevR [Parafilimonas sp.]|nr:type I-B CRISPR-associated protein Cas7/Cst2/DevR [Parafilimonas sp.]
MAKLNNIAGALLIDATAAFLNGAGLGTSSEDKNKVLPKTFREKVNGKAEEVPYVSAQSWRRWLRDTTNEENKWNPSELRAIGEGSDKGTTNKIATELNPIDFPEDDLFGYMKAGSKNEESIQRTSPFKSSILKGIKNMRTINNDEAFVHLKEGTPLPYSTKFYSTHLEGFFNLEYYRLCVYDNIGSRQELSSELVAKYKGLLNVSELSGKFKRYELKNAEQMRKVNAAGLLKGLAFLRGGAKQAAFGSDVSPKVLIFAGLESANPIFNNLFVGTGEKPALNIELLHQLVKDYKDKLATPIYVGIRKGYLQNENEVQSLGDVFIVDSPVAVINQFTQNYLSDE